MNTYLFAFPMSSNSNPMNYFQLALHSVSTIPNARGKYWSFGSLPTSMSS